MNTDETPASGAGEALPDKAALLRMVMDAVPDAMVAIDDEGRIVSSNDQLEELFGYDRDHLRGLAAERLVPEAYRESNRTRVRDHLREPISRSMGQGLNFIGLHANGREFPFVAMLRPVQGIGEAKVLAVIRPSPALEASPPAVDEPLFRKLINSIVDYAVFMLDREGRVMTWNRGAAAIKGYQADEIIGRSFSIFFPPEEQAAGTPARILASAAREGRHQSEGWRVRKDGSRFLAHVTIDAVRDRSGAVTGFAKVTRDITQARRAEDLEKAADRLAQEAERQRLIALERDQAASIVRKSSETLNAVIEAAPLGICMINGEGVFELWNSSCERIYGLAGKDILGKSWDDALQMAQAAGMLPVDGAWPTRPEGMPREPVLRRFRRDGVTIDAEVVYAPVQPGLGPTAGYVLIVSDVTERKHIEAQLHQAQKMEAIGQLTGGIAHDFNNLLSIVICNLELMMEDAAPESELRGSGQMALDASLRGAELIHQMLAFSRKQRLEPAMVRLNELIEGMTNMLKRSLGENIDITLKVVPDLWPSVLDPAQLQTALVNLATNARDAMPGGGRLVIECANTALDEAYARLAPGVRPGDYIMISVSDTGAGMSPDVAARAFDPFFTTKGEGRGTGLGLSMVFGFVKQSSGHIRIYSEPGQGTTVKLYLPRAGVDVPDASTTAAAGRAERQGGNLETILVVEDNPDLARSVESALRKAGFSPVMARDAATALAIIDGPGAIDLLFTDVILGAGMNGVDLATEAVRRRPGLKVLFTSGFAETALTQNGMAVIANRMVAKPYLRADLLARISSILGSTRAS